MDSPFSPEFSDRFGMQASAGVQRAARVRFRAGSRLFSICNVRHRRVPIKLAAGAVMLAAGLYRAIAGIVVRPTPPGQRAFSGEFSGDFG